MFYVKRITNLLCFCTSIIVVNIFVIPEIKSITQGFNKVSEQPQSEMQPAWLPFVKNSTAARKIIRFTAVDKFDAPVLIELRVVDKEDQDLKAILGRFSEIASQSMAPSEVQFLKANPNLPFEDEHYNEFRPFFIKGVDSVDCGLIEEKMRARIKSFVGKDASAFCSSNLYIFGEIKNKETQSLQGVISFGISPAVRDGDIKLTNIAILPELQNRGLGKLLTSSIFKIIPQIKRIILTVRPTNRKAFDAYFAWGFTKDPNPICDVTHKIKLLEQFTFLEYMTDKHGLLQGAATMLIEY